MPTPRHLRVLGPVLGPIVLCGVVMSGVAGCAARAAPAPTTVIVTPPATSSAPAGPSTTDPSATPSATTSATAAGPDDCRTAELTLSITDVSGAAGSVTEDIVLQNTGNRRCVLRGYPGVSFVAGDDGHQVGAAATETGDRLGEVSLAPGSAAVAPVRIPNVGVADAADCRPTEVRGLRVYPPGETAAGYVADPRQACSATGPSRPTFSVEVVRPRA